MNDYEILKATFKNIGCNFLSTQTLIGFTVIVVVNLAKEIHWEFDINGKFIGVK